MKIRYDQTGEALKLTDIHEDFSENARFELPPETRQPVSGYLWGALAVLTCPCHLPILAAVLAGTTAGAFLGEHWGVAALALTGLFVLAVTRLLRAFRGGS